MDKYFVNHLALDQYHDFFFILWLMLSISFASVEAFQITSREVELFLETN